MNATINYIDPDGKITKEEFNDPYIFMAKDGKLYNFDGYVWRKNVMTYGGTPIIKNVNRIINDLNENGPIGSPKKKI
jgi:hypothetical protein